MSITAEYRSITADQLTWFKKKPAALYEHLFPQFGLQSSGKQPGKNRRANVWSALADFKAFTEAMQNPGSNDALIISKLPSLLSGWRAQLGDEATQALLGNLLKQHPTVAAHLKENPTAAQPNQEDAHRLNIEKAWEGIHFVLTGNKEPGETSISRAIFGDRVIPDDLGIMGYGPVRVLTPEQVNECAQELRRAAPELSTKFDSKKLVQAKVYAMSDDSEELAYLNHHYDRLLHFYAEASAQKNAMAAYMV
jgi:hypothetical protein